MKALVPLEVIKQRILLIQGQKSYYPFKIAICDLKRTGRKLRPPLRSS
jgi:hypothetical protein